MTEHLLENGQAKAGPLHLPGSTDLVGILLRRKLHLVLGAVLGVLLGVLFYVGAPRKYESVGQILVLKKDTEKPMQAAEKDGGSVANAPLQDFLETHKAVLKSPLVVRQAVEKAHLRDLDM